MEVIVCRPTDKHREIQTTTLEGVMMTRQRAEGWPALPFGSSFSRAFLDGTFLGRGDDDRAMVSMGFPRK